MDLYNSPLPFIRYISEDYSREPLFTVHTESYVHMKNANFLVTFLQSPYYGFLCIYPDYLAFVAADKSDFQRGLTAIGKIFTGVSKLTLGPVLLNKSMLFSGGKDFYQALKSTLGLDTLNFNKLVANLAQSENSIFIPIDRITNFSYSGGILVSYAARIEFKSNSNETYVLEADLTKSQYNKFSASAKKLIKL